MTKKVKTRHRKFTDAERKDNHLRGQRLERNIELLLHPKGKLKFKL